MVGQATDLILALNGEDIDDYYEENEDMDDYYEEDEDIYDYYEEDDDIYEDFEDDTDLLDEYILPYSDSMYYTEEDLSYLTEEELRLARNEIYARHGRIFNSTELNEYFMEKSWYVPEYEPEEFDAWGDSILNEYEIANKNLIVWLEEMEESEE